MKYSDARLLHPVIQHKLRQKAVKMFLKNKKLTDISKQLGVSRQAVYNWIKKHSDCNVIFFVDSRVSWTLNSKKNQH